MSFGAQYADQHYELNHEAVALDGGDVVPGLRIAAAELLLAE
jgi:hypothetical protein